MRARRITPYAIQAVVLLAVLVPFFPGVFLRGEVLVPAKFMYELPPWSAHSPPDLPYQNPPSTEVTLAVAVWYRLTDLYFDRGELPLWNSYEYTGAPLIGNMQSAIFYPPRLLFRLAGDTYVGMTIYIVFRFWLCGFNAFLAGRLLGLRLPFANLYSILFMVAGYNQFWTFYPPPDVMAWLPLVFAGSEVALNGRYRLGAGLLMISVAMGVLAAHPSTFLLGCIGIGLYALARLIAMRGPVRHVVWCAVSAGGAFCVSMGICAIQVLPFAEYLPHTARLTALTGSRLLESFSYSGYDLLCLWGPRMCGTEYSKNFWEDTNLTYGGMLYLGMTTWVCLSLLTKWSALDQGLRRRIGALLGVSALCFYGASAFPGAALVHELPVISGSRPAYFLAFPTVAVPLCAVFAVQAWVGGGAAPRDLVRPAILAVAIAVIVGAAVVSAQYLSPGYIEVMGTGVDLNSFMMKQCAIAAAFTVAGFLIVLWCALDSKRAKWPVVALCLLAVADQAVALWDLMPSNPRKYVAPNTQITDFLQAQPQPCRVRFDPASNRAGYQVLYGIEAYDGYDAIFPMRFKRFYDALDRRPGGTADALLSCDYTLLPSGKPVPDAYRTVFEAEGVIVVAHKDPLPRARLVDAAVTFATTDALLEAMTRPDFDPRTTVYVDVPLDFTLPPRDGSPAGDAAIESWSTQQITIRASARRESVLVYAEGFAPGWEATVDGSPANIFPAYHQYRGVHLQPGDHTVEFRYRPKGYLRGRAISFVSLAASLCAALALLWGVRPRAVYPVEARP